LLIYRITVELSEAEGSDGEMKLLPSLMCLLVVDFSWYRKHTATPAGQRKYHPEQSPQWCVMDINVTQCRAVEAENHEIQTINAGLALVNVTDRSLYTPQ